MNELSTSMNNELSKSLRVVCPSCGSPDIFGRLYGGSYSITCPKCGIELEVSARDLTDLEGACAVVNASEKLRWQVNKTKMEAQNLGIPLAEISVKDANTIIHLIKGENDEQKSQNEEGC